MPLTDFIAVGGARILDFCNTKVVHTNYTEDTLLTPDDLKRFIKVFFHLRQSVTEPAFERTLLLRTHLRDYFETLHSRSRHSLAIDRLNTFIENEAGSIALTLKAEMNCPLVWRTESSRAAPSILLQEFFSFLLNAKKDRIRKCKNPNCSHIFYDNSRNSKRLWCAMDSCGNIMKVRAFRTRSQK